MFRAILLSVLILASTLRGAHCGVLNIFNSKSDLKLATALDLAFAKGRNDIGLLLKGEITTPIEEDVTFWCGNKNAPQLNQTFLDDPDVRQKIDFSKPTMIITHGWLGGHSAPWIQRTTPDVLNFLDTNVCVVGWDRLSKYVYYQAARENTLLVSNYTTRFVEFLTNEGMSLDNVTLVGHSLGAQICGQVGHNLDGKIAEIYGLDPAGPLFTFPVDHGLQYRLDESDAKYVQMILTSRNALGVGKGDGHENFYPNGGDVPQPNCVKTLLTSDAEIAEQIFCSHLHSTSLFRFSVDPAIVYKAKECFNWMSYFLKSCVSNPADILGIHSKKKGGNFYLRTSVDSPYVD